MITRRRLLAGCTVGAALGVLPSYPYAASATCATRTIPSTGEPLPRLGMGTWITFNVSTPAALEQRRAVLQAFFAGGGRLIDSSPMYDAAESVLGRLLPGITGVERLFSATKVWTWGERAGVDQMEASRGLWGVPQFDLLQVHNLLDVDTHLDTLRAWRAAGRVRYIGVTTSHGRRHGDVEKLIASVPLDFVQLTLNIADRVAERRLLPFAAERGIAVIVNRPFRGGTLFRRVAGHPLPGWATEFGATSWARFLLKFVLAHPAVTCAIPATSRPDHMVENMGACGDPLPDAATRERMARYIGSL